MARTHRQKANRFRKLALLAAAEQREKTATARAQTVKDPVKRMEWMAKAEEAKAEVKRLKRQTKARPKKRKTQKTDPVSLLKGLVT